MFAFFQPVFKSMRVLLLFSGLIALSACDIKLPSSIPSILPTKPVQVALLVPGESGSANDAKLAQSLENAARLAMSELDDVEIDLRVYNTAGNADMAANVAVTAVNDGAKIILGPVFAKNANAVGKAVSGQNINVLSFSNNASIAGGNVFILGNSFDNTAQRLVQFASRQGKGNIMILHGDDAAETLGKQAISRAINDNGANLVGSTAFELTQRGIVNALPKISDAARKTNAQSLFFTSGTSGALPLLAGLLPENGINPAEIQFIGLQRLDIPENARELPGLQGSWFALPDPALTAQFSNHYSAQFGEPPHPIAALAYDGIAAIGALVKTHKREAVSAAALTQPQGFIGVSGIFRLRPDGTNQRGLAIAQIQNQNVQIIDPAPRQFEGN